MSDDASVNPALDGIHISADEAAARLGVSVDSVEALVSDGVLPGTESDNRHPGFRSLWVPALGIDPLLEKGSSGRERLIREAAFDWLDRRTDGGRESLSYLELEEFTFDGLRLPLKNRYKGIWKPGAFAAALSMATAFRPHGSERPYRDERGADGLFRYKWKGDDEQDADNRALRSAMEQRTPLIWFIGVAKGIYQPVYPVYLVAEEASHQQFVMALHENRGRNQIEDNPSPGAAEAVRRYRNQITRVRMHQRLFRSTVIRAYGTRCAVCNLGHSNLLDAAHIIPDRDEDGIASVTNGMAMCKIHHAAFDTRILGVRPDLVVEIRKDILEEVDGPMLKYGLQDRHGQHLMAVPSSRAARPDSKLLERAYKNFVTT